MAKILIAEDEKDIRDLIVFALETQQHEVIAVANGEDAVNQAMAHMPDLVMLDMRMPKMGGLEACETIKGNPETQHISVVFLSGKEVDEELERGRAAGAIDFIMKPFDPMGLINRVQDILGQVGAS